LTQRIIFHLSFEIFHLPFWEEEFGLDSGLIAMPEGQAQF